MQRQEGQGSLEHSQRGLRTFHGQISHSSSKRCLPHKMKHFIPKGKKENKTQSHKPIIKMRKPRSSKTNPSIIWKFFHTFSFPDEGSSAAADEPPIARSLDAYQEQSVKPMLEAAKAVGNEALTEASERFAQVIAILRQLLVATATCAKPKDDQWATILKPVMELVLVAPYRPILRYYRCDTPYRAIYYQGG